MTDNGGRVSTKEQGRPWCATGSASSPPTIADAAAAVFDGVAVQGLAPKAAARHAEAITVSAARA